MKMMKIDPGERITAFEALNHSWFREINISKIVDLDAKKEKIANLGMYFEQKGKRKRNKGNNEK